MTPKTKQNFLITLVILTLFFTAPLKAQVTIGDQTEPHDFSILELSTAKLKGGLRLPQLTTAQRDSTSNSWDMSLKEKAEGLIIYNKTTNCIEFWNRVKWISLCSGIPIDCNTVIYPTLNSFYDFAGPATIANLVDSLGGNVYDAEIGGNLYNNSDPLNSGTYYVEQKIGDCPPRRVMIEVIVSTVAVSNISIDACVNTMYDFQYQTLSAYGDNGLATQWQWYAKQNSASNYTPISGATTASYTIPTHLYNGLVDFKVEAWNAVNNTNRCYGTLDIEFIATNGSDGVELRALRYKDNISNPTGKLKFSYLNLGSEFDNEGNQNACDFGDLYQWGRIADDHEIIIWTKPSVGGNISFDATTASNQISGTGAVYDSNPNTALEGGTPFYQITDQTHYDKFMLVSNTWNLNYSDYQYFWNSETQFAKTANDPCPIGWRIPSRYEWGAIFKSTPSNISSSSAATENTWTWRPNIGNRIMGGYIVTYGRSGDGSLDNTKRIFFPASGYRYHSTGLLTSTFGYYWSSTATKTANAYRGLFIYSDGVETGYTLNVRGAGYNLRCVENSTP